MVPPVLAWSNEWVGRMSLPARNAISGSSYPNLGMALIPKAYIKHHMPALGGDDLAAGHSIFFPLVVWVGPENGVVFVLDPLQTVCARRVTDGIRLILLAS